MKTLSALMVLGALTFIGIVGYLQFSNSDYNPVYQHMSELAIKKQGVLMIVAFGGFSAAILCVGMFFRFIRVPIVIPAMFWAGSLCMFGAGIIKLSESAIVHILLVFVAFAFSVLGMILTPVYVTGFSNRIDKIITFGVIGLTISSIIAGSYGLTYGISQRGAAAGVLLWLIWTGLVKSRVYN